MDFLIKPYTKECIPDVLAFERRLREEEDFWGWDIDDAYVRRVENSFAAGHENRALSLLAYADGQVVGRIDACLLHSHFEGAVTAYLDWICVLKSFRHRGAARALMAELRRQLKAYGAGTLVGLIAANEEAQRFYRALEQAKIRDEGIWIDL